MKTIWTNKYFLMVVAFFCILGFVYGINRSQKNAVPESSLSKVELGTLIQRVTISGSVQPLRKTLITASYNGYVRKLFVKLGDNVKSGDPIASVATSLTSLETVYPLRTPLAGKVVQVMKSEGEFVKQNDPTDFIARIDDLSKLYLNASIPEVDRVKIQLGQEATVRASAVLNRTYKAVVRELTLAARDNDKWQRSTVVEFPVRLELIKADEDIQPGMSVLVDIVTLKKENVLLLRHEFIEKEKDDYFVTMASGDRLLVHLGQQNEEMAEILDGVKEGAKVRKVDFAKLIDK